ncbi:hypothetical protein AB0B89_36425 [Sphaerisporangium sp. NPDC049002]|uniref:hypothetical protein n=1 Tax=Sphaerisporangium sp. NPDC049002 TaxID=3155392 RepID=UPI0034110625
MTTIPIEQFVTGDAAVCRASEYVDHLERLLESLDGTSVASTVHLLTEAARLYLEQAAANETHPPTHQGAFELARRDLIELNTAFYMRLKPGQRTELAIERGFKHAGHVEWQERTQPALVFWLNNAYPYSLRKAKIQARAMIRAGLEREACDLLLSVADDSDGRAVTAG